MEPEHKALGLLYVLIVVFFSFLILFASGAIVGNAQAQENITETPIATSTATPTETATVTLQNDSGENSTVTPTTTEAPTETANNNQQESTQTPQREIAAEVSDNVYVESYTFDGKNSTVTLVLNQYDDSVPDRVTISNFLYKIDNGVKEYISRTYTVQGRTEITFGLNKINNEMAVLVRHDGSGKLLTWEGGLFNFDNSYSTGETAMFLGFGALLGITAVTGVAVKRKWEISTKVRRRL